MVELLDADQLLAATDHDPIVKAVVLNGRMIGNAWSANGAFAWLVTHRHDPSIMSIGNPQGAVRIVESMDRGFPGLRHASLPRGWLAHLSTYTPERVSNWEWFWTATAPESQSQSADARWLEDSEDDDVRGLLEAAMPDASAWPGDERVKRWAGIRDSQGRLVACTADTAHATSIGHLSSVATAPDQRRKGYAAALTAWITGQHLNDGAEMVTLGMYSDNAAARRLYTNLGFVCEHEFTSARITSAARQPA